MQIRQERQHENPVMSHGRSVPSRYSMGLKPEHHSAFSHAGIHGMPYYNTPEMYVASCSSSKVGAEIVVERHENYPSTWHPVCNSGFFKGQRAIKEKLFRVLEAAYACGGDQAAVALLANELEELQIVAPNWIQPDRYEQRY